MTAVNKFGKNALQLAEEGALAYQSSFDLTKTEVSKAPVDSFIRAYEKAVAGLPPEHAPEFMEAMKKAVGRQSFVETGYVLQLITRSLSSKTCSRKNSPENSGRKSPEQSRKTPGSLMSAAWLLNTPWTCSAKRRKNNGLSFRVQTSATFALDAFTAPF